MEWIDGVKIAEKEQLIGAGFDLDEIARRGATLYLQMIFSHGYYHADPHPGNIVILPGNVIGLLDFGMVGRVQERLREDIEEMLLAIVQNDVALLTFLIKRVGTVPPDLDESGLVYRCGRFRGDLFHPIARSVRSGRCAQRHDGDRAPLSHRVCRPRPPRLIKVLVTLEGTARLLCPRFSLMEVMQPFHRRMLLERLSPLRQWRKFRRLRLELDQLIEVFPRRMIDILEQVQTGTFDVHLDHRGLGPSVNRLVLGMLGQRPVPGLVAAAEPGSPSPALPRDELPGTPQVVRVRTDRMFGGRHAGVATPARLASLDISTSAISWRHRESPASPGRPAQRRLRLDRERGRVGTGRGRGRIGPRATRCVD